MQKMSKWVVLSLMLAGGAAASGALQNASFEQPEDPANVQSDKALGWGRWGHWINRETGWSPTRSGNCLIGYHHWQIDQKDDSGLYQDVEDVPANSDCTFRVYGLCDEGTNIKNIELRIEPMGGGPKLASTSYSASHLAPGQWTALAVSAKTLQQGVRVLIIVTPSDGSTRTGAVKLDDAELVVN